MQSYNVLYVRFDTLCASQIIFGKIYPLEMLFRVLRFGVVLSDNVYPSAILPKRNKCFNNVHVVLLRKLQQRAV